MKFRWHKLFTLLIVMITFGCSDHLKEEPERTDVTGMWNVTDITRIVEKWLNNNGIDSLPPDAWIKFFENGTFETQDLPIILSGAYGGGIKCGLYSGTGTWRVQYNDVWKIEVSIDSPNQSWYYAFHKDSSGIYLVDGMDWETATGVTLRKENKQQGSGGIGVERR
ncbi:MAG: hypothetical protein U1F87_08210 [Kiritimatiellia bacterium]